MKVTMHDVESCARKRDMIPYGTQRRELLRKLCPALQTKVLKAVEGFRKILGEELNDFQKLSLLYQMICAGGTYDYGKPQRSLSYSFLGALKGLAVCAGYAKLFVLLVGELTDTYSPYMTGGYIAENIDAAREFEDGHAWVIIRDNSGNAWHFDPTWDLGKTRFSWFFKRDADMSGRIWATRIMPACTVKFTGKIYKNQKKLDELLAYYRSMPQRFESGDFSVD